MEDILPTGSITALLEGDGIRISMDGRRRALDNIYVQSFAIKV